MKLTAAIAFTISTMGLTACGTSPVLPEPGPARYSATFLPAVLVGDRDGCVRHVGSARLDLDGPSGGSFDLVVDVTEDCTRGTGGFEAWQIGIAGEYQVVGDQVRFVTNDGATPTFLGRLRADGLTLSLPVRADSLGLVPVALPLGLGGPLPMPRHR